MPRHIVATEDEIAPGQRKIVDVAGRAIGVFNIDGEYFAVRNRCPHQGGPVCEGYLTGFLKSSVPGEYTYTRRGEILRCPWHGWEFDVKTGQSWLDPKRVRAKSYQVSVAPSDTLDTDTDIQQGAYTAETYDVTVDRQYVIVEVP